VPNLDGLGGIGAVERKRMIESKLQYNPDTGDLRWLKRETHEFATLNACNTWNRKFAGEPAGTIVSGRVQIRYARRSHSAMRVIVKMMTGEYPPDDVAVVPINKDGTDLRWRNLRMVSKRTAAGMHRGGS